MIHFRFSRLLARNRSAHLTLLLPSACSISTSMQVAQPTASPRRAWSPILPKTPCSIGPRSRLLHPFPTASASWHSEKYERLEDRRMLPLPTKNGFPNLCYDLAPYGKRPRIACGIMLPVVRSWYQYCCR